MIDTIDGRVHCRILCDTRDCGIQIPRNQGEHDHELFLRATKRGWLCSTKPFLNHHGSQCSQICPQCRTRTLKLTLAP